MVNRNHHPSLSWNHLLTSGGRKTSPDTSEILRQIAGIVYDGGHEAIYDLGTALVQIRLAADGSLRLRADAKHLTTDLAALHASSQLPGNVRFAHDKRGRAVVADTQINGAAHLPRTLQWLGDGIRQALDADGPAASPGNLANIEKRDVAHALAQMPWAADGVVGQDDGWELRPRLRGDAVPVRLILDGSCLSVTRIVLPLPDPATSAAEAVANQAIRFNDQLRHARLVARDGRLVAETRLHGGLIEAGWLSQAAYAVAQAGRHVATPLRILSEQTQVAEKYIAVFCSTLEQPA